MVCIILLYRIRKTEVDKAQVVDVDGSSSYLYKKYQLFKKHCRSTLNLELLSSPPMYGWETASETNAAVLSKKLP